MAKNLYIHTLTKNGVYNLDTWEDVKVTRDKGRIVKKRGADYDLSMGHYKEKENLDKVSIKTTGYPKPAIDCTQMISFDKKTLNQEDVVEMCKPFLEELQKYKNKLENDIIILDDKISLFKNMVIDNE